jgi:division protein 1
MENINSDLAKLATTASVLVTSATNNASINDMLQRNKAFASTFDPQRESSPASSTNIVNTNIKSNGLLNLLAKHGDNIRVAQTLKRSNFTGDGKKKKDFNILSNDMLNEIPDSDIDSGRSGSPDILGNNNAFPRNSEETTFSLFQGFTAVLPEVDETIQNIKGMSGKLLQDDTSNNNKKNKNKNKKDKNRTHITIPRLQKIDEITVEKIRTCQNQRVLLNFKSDINYHLDLLEIRKGLSKSEIAEIDAKIDRLYIRRKEISDNVDYYEKNEVKLENNLLEIKERLEFIKDINVPENIDDSIENNVNDNETTNNNENNENESKNKNKNIHVKKRNTNSKTNKSANNSNFNTQDKFKAGEDDYDDDYVTVYMEEDSTSYSRITSTTRNFKSGDQIHKFQAHQDAINCIAIDEPYGKLLTCSMDNTVRVWDMNRYKCIGLLEGHYAYVDCVSINDNLAFTGSMDATVKMWDLNYFNKMHYNDNESDDALTTPLLNSFDGHVDIVTALSYNNGELVTGSNDKTIRQWDLNTGHLLQTIDVMWASSMINSTINFGNNKNNSNINSNNSTLINNSTEYPYISTLQVFDAALASGSNDGIVRLWDLRSGEIIRQLFGHTGAITTLQFDKNFNLVTGSADRSLRIWDLRTGGLLDSFSYDNPIKKIMFDDLKIVSVVENERGLHIYDRVEQNHWVLGGDLLDSNGTVSEKSDFVNDMVFNGNYLVEGRANGVVHIWNV